MKVDVQYDNSRQQLLVQVVIPQSELIYHFNKVATGIPLETGRNMVDAIAGKLQEEVLTLMRLGKGALK